MSYKVFKGPDNYYKYSGETTCSYVVVDMESRKPYLAYRYEGISAKDVVDSVRAKKYGGEYKIKPTSLEFTNAENAEAYSREQHNRRYNNTKFRDMYETVEDCGFYVPKEYVHSPVEVVVKKDALVTETMIERLNKVNVDVCIGEDLSARRKNGMTEDKDILEVLSLKDGSIYYLCDSDADAYTIRSHMIIMKDYMEHTDSQYSSRGCSSRSYYGRQNSVKDKVYYVVPEGDNCVVVYYISKEVVADKNKVTISYRVENSMRHTVGGETVCYRHLKRSDRVCDSFEAMHINSQNIRWLGEIYYEGADSFWDFCNKNEKFMRMCGFQAALKYSSKNLGLEAFFIVYLSMLNTYPVLEQIVKMGHSKLFFSLYESILMSGNKEEIARKVQRINELVNNEATKGKEALRFPPYVGDYLIRKDAPLEEYYDWRDLYELTHITKEQFENYTDSFNFAWVNSQLNINHLCNILKFGYPLEKLTNYIIKQCQSEDDGNRYYHSSAMTRMVSMFADYLNMCDVLGVVPDKYPQNIQKQHDDISAIYREKQHEEESKKIRVIGEECEKYVIPDESELDDVGIPKLFKELTVVFPKSITDFVNEGNQQHNCVGSYPSNVKSGRDVIFFIRKKESPEKSFITAECTQRGLGQCYYSNNRYVESEELRKFASYIASKIRKGCSSGKIHALDSI